MTDDELAAAIDKALMAGNVAVGDFPRFAPEPFLVKIRKFLVD
jgi:hypothetical protein